jgi:cyclase
VSDGIFAYVQPDGSWWINNTGFLVGRTGIVSVDGCSTADRTRAYLNAIAKVSDRPVRTLINTHHHGDHTFGNYLFAGATIVGHDGVRQALLDWGSTFGAVLEGCRMGDVELTLTPPFSTYTDRVKLSVDDLECESSHVGTPPTPPTTPSCGCPNDACCSAVTCSSMEEHPSCSKAASVER